ncbi:hypothetical protein XELAEV_18001016mg [Xenopus laevis]|nr:hypothetical protein XELAEV_18001016mg [Xenopus laevis]
MPQTRPKTSWPPALLPSTTTRNCFCCGSNSQLQVQCPRPPKVHGVPTPRPVAALAQEASIAQQQAVQTGREFTQSASEPHFTNTSNPNEYVILGVHWKDKQQRSNHIIPVAINGKPAEGFLDSGA